MLAQLRTVPKQAEIAGNAGSHGCCRAGPLAMLLILCGMVSGPAFGQAALPSGRPDNTVPPSPPSPGSVPAGSPESLPWGPSLDWSPHKPGFTIEPDCFVNADIALVFPHLGSLLRAPVRLGDTGPVRSVALGNAGLDTAVSPLIQVGALRFGPDYAELALSYRLLATEGREFNPGFDASGGAVIRSQLNLQTFSLDYIRHDCPLGMDTFLSWEVGARLQVVFFDTQAQTAGGFEQARNYFFGAGPHAGFTLTGSLEGGLGWFGHFDAALLGAYNTDQNFVATTHDPVNGILSGAASQQQSQFAPSLAVQAGLSWKPDGLANSCLRGGYQFEEWYNLGRVKGSRGDLNAHGLFASWEWTF